jgi:hypothetical protein
LEWNVRLETVGDSTQEHTTIKKGEWEGERKLSFKSFKRSEKESVRKKGTQSDCVRFVDVDVVVVLESNWKGALTAKHQSLKQQDSGREAVL